MFSNFFDFNIKQPKILTVFFNQKDLLITKGEKHVKNRGLLEIFTQTSYNRK